MHITHHILLSLGFKQLTDQPDYYVYKHIHGRLLPQTGGFLFRDFSVPIVHFDDLVFLLDLIDHQDESKLMKYPLHYN
ncbi:hypothetical protein [Spirosoma panaciterrae]|uniref:hypothetical protein n=1 Tax=Spirosoma panaciterrae TaxID=496058 RepID=UPI00036E8047|nr:hypothetical protein [Spirosoma panaciterrae]